MAKHLSYLLFVFILLITLIVSSAHGQSLWEWQSPFPQGNTLYDFDVRGTSASVAVGERAVVMMTIDGGTTWNVISLAAGLTDDLKGVSFVDISTVVAVGKNGNVIRIVDNGSSWTNENSGTVVNLNDVDFADPVSGTAVGDDGVILFSDDGGVIWTPRSSGTTADLFGVYFSDSNTGTIVGAGGTILRTVDGGVTWIPQISGVTAALNGVYFYDTNTGIAVGSGPVVIGTTDAGINWTPQPMPAFPPDFTVSLESVFMSGPDDAVAAGTFETDYCEKYGLMMRTVDGGASWDWQTKANFLFGIGMFDANSGLAVGSAGIICQVIAGVDWLQIGGGRQSFFMRAIDFGSPTHGVAIMSDEPVTGPTMGSRLYYTEDGGVNWNLVTAWPRFFAVAFADAMTVYAAGQGRLDLDHGSLIWKSTDGGETWIDFYGTYCAPDGSGCDTYFSCATAIDFAGPNFGVAVGTQGAIVVIENGVATRVTSPTNVTLKGVSVPSSAAAYAVGDNGVIVKGEFSGSSWTLLNSGTALPLNDVSFTEDMRGTAVGAQGTILHTEDGGINWVPQAGGTTANLTSVSFLDALNGVIIAGATLLITKDGGETWVPEATPSEMTDVDLIDVNNVTAVGGHESIIARRDVCIPVLFRQFTARTSAHLVELLWSVSGDVPLDEFQLYRQDGSSLKGAVLIARLNTEQRSFMDSEVIAGATYRYKLAAVDMDGRETWSQEVTVKVPGGGVKLLQNYPNPFKPNTTIRFILPSQQHVVLSIFDVTGHHVITLVDAVRGSGEQIITWNGNDKSGRPVGSGIYFYRLRVESKVLSRKMMMLK